jgi:hypothetical protein
MSFGKDAGLKIDPATCEIQWWWANAVDDYGIHQALGELPSEPTTDVASCDLLTAMDGYQSLTCHRRL